jgi:hypothetical protein
LTEVHTLATGADRSTSVMRQAEDVHSAAFDPGGEAELTLGRDPKVKRLASIGVPSPW